MLFGNTTIQKVLYDGTFDTCATGSVLKTMLVLNNKSISQGDGKQSTSSKGECCHKQNSNPCTNSQNGQTVMTFSHDNFVCGGTSGNGGDGGGGDDDEKRPHQRIPPSSKVGEEEKEEIEEKEEKEEKQSIEDSPMDISPYSSLSVHCDAYTKSLVSHEQEELEPSDCSMPSAESQGKSYIYDSGQIILNAKTFSYRQMLGQGSFGACALVIDYNSKEVLAMKQIQRDAFDPKEIYYLRKLQSSPFVIQFHGYQELPKCFRIFMDHAQGGDLQSFLHSHFNQLDNMFKFKLVQDIMEGVRFIHSNSIVHADIKSENILLISKDGGNYRAVLSDFGLSLDIEDPHYASSKIRGTIRYRSPELCRGFGCNTFSSDIWACGCVLLEIDYGRPPWECAAERGDGAVIYTIGSARQPPIPENASDMYRPLYIATLALKPENRRTAMEICHLLNQLEQKVYGH